MIQSTQTFLNYFDGIRKRTLNYIRAVPPDKINWSPQAGEFTCADIIRHIASGEKMFVGVVMQGNMYLLLLGVKPPHIYGLGVEDLIAKATG